ncbi:hypothetical protein SAMN05443144_12522 [Fodinibius roseus]|uniref:Uncharacterized protein n=1 Tax=Fodinibius roseus TaxID=1194090 RepID=A0A1M5IZ83_9BACT|nr:hypothetical protein SAMN05443144_12522 [Fodinibius roseus]
MTLWSFLKQKLKTKKLSQTKKAGLAIGLIKMQEDFDRSLDNFKTCHDEET